MKYLVYVLLSSVAHKTYVGFTNNLERRLEEHNKGESNYTKRYIPWKVIYTEEYNTLSEARERERYLKSASGRKRVLKDLFQG